MRVGDATLYRLFLRGLTARRDEIGDAVRSLSDGKKVRRASDDPSGVHESLGLRGRLAHIEGYQRAVKASRYDLATIDYNLGQVRCVQRPH